MQGASVVPLLQHISDFKAVIELSRSRFVKSDSDSVGIDLLKHWKKLLRSVAFSATSWIILPFWSVRVGIEVTCLVRYFAVFHKVLGLRPLKSLDLALLIILVILLRFILYSFHIKTSFQIYHTADNYKYKPLVQYGLC